MEGNRIADEVLVSTGIYDSVSKEPYAGYVVIKGDSILEVGRGQVPDKYRKPSIPVHDYGDATICAGFGDTHTFFTGCIIDNLGIDLTGIEDLEQLEVVVRKELSAKKGKAVFGNHLSRAGRTESDGRVLKCMEPGCTSGVIYTRPRHLCHEPKSTGGIWIQPGGMLCRSTLQDHGDLFK